ncbi:MAG TPA: prenyltransferase/squalene oxidase repeat-containing protein [Solirubrobacteraceae bacterium]
MTWTVAAFAILFAALAAGFAWYERTKPTSRILALVATLAALAALGRIAFAPLPNIKPTTDIVVLAGFALGAAPGFAVGATAALTSNFFFGQGPWTPWQMVGWGLCGILGALLARATRGDAGRWQLAATCALAGLLYGVLLDVHDWLIYAPERSGAQYVVVAGTSLPFNLAHIAGNVVFAATLGPALLRVLTRFRARCEIDWRPLAPAAGALLTALVVLQAQPADASTASNALRFLERAQNRDGGWGQAPGAASTPLYSAWVLIGQAAARNGRCDRAGVRYVQRKGVGATGDIERTIVALRACKRGTGALDGRLRGRQRGDGSFNGLTNLTSFGILALRAAGTSPRSARVRRAAAFITRQQNRDGGFSFARRGSLSGVDDTAAAVQALVAAGRSRRRGPVARAVRFLRARQRADGGFGASGRLASNAQSSAWAVQAFLAAGVNPDRVRRGGARSPLAYIRSLQNGDGSVRYSRTSRQSPVWVTAQALAAVARKRLPVR